MTYVDGFVLVVPTANKAACPKHVEAAAAVFRGYGALSVVECRGDDVPDGQVTSFPMAVKCRADERSCCSWILRPSREVRNRGDTQNHDRFPRLDPAVHAMPFDGKHMIFDGLEMIVDA